MKKITTMMLILLISVCTVAFANGSSETKISNNEKGPVILKLGHQQPVGILAHKALLQLADEVKEKTDGAVEIQIFPAGQLGNERDMTEGLYMGTLDMAWISVGVLENFEPKFSIFSLPYIFTSYDHVHKVCDSPLGDSIFESLKAKKGIKTLAVYDQGFRFVWNNIAPIHTLEDLKGIKIRTPESPVMMGTFDALGANPTPIPWGELYTSLQTKVVDAYEVFPESVIANKLDEITKYGTQSRHIYAGSALLINDSTFNKLTAEQQDIVIQATKSSELYNRESLKTNEVKYIKTLESENIEVYELPNAELEKFRNAVKPLYSEYAEKVGGMDFINSVLSIN
jgi:tripartite ATP-independent transporter DctP family solute receptor